MSFSLDKAYEYLLIRPSERRNVLYFFGVFFLIGCGLSLGRGTADALFFKRYGIEYLPIMFSITGALLALVFTLYAAFVDQQSSNKLMSKLFKMAAISIMASWALIRFGNYDHVYPVYFLIYEVVSEVLILHLSLYVMQNFSTQQAKRLVPLILAGTQSGYILGGLILAASTRFLNVADILLLWFSLLLLAAHMVVRYHNKNGTSPYYRPGPKSRNQLKQAVSQLSQGLKFTRDSQMLKYMSIAFFFMVIAFYTLCYSTNRLYNQTFTDEAELAAFFGLIGSFNALIALLIQLLITNKVIKHFGVQKVNLIFPFMITISFVALLGAYILPIAILATFTKDAIMPAFRNPVRNIFFASLPLHFQGRARAITIGLILPAALCTTGLILWLVQRADIPHLFLLAGVLMSMTYLIFNMQMNKAYVPTIVQSLRQKVYIPEKGLFDADSGDKNVESLLTRGVSHQDAEISFAAAKALLDVQGTAAVETVLPTLKSYNHSYQDRLVKILFPYMERPHIERLWSIAYDGDAHLKSTVKTELYRHFGSDCFSDIAMSLQESNPRLVATGIYGVIINNIHGLMDESHALWRSYLYSDETGKMLCGIELCMKFDSSEYTSRLVELSKHSHNRVKRQACIALSNTSFDNNPDTAEIVNRLRYEQDATLREAACRIAITLPVNQRIELLLPLLNDAHPSIRNKAAHAIFHKGFPKSQLLDWVYGNPLPPRAQSAVIETLLQKDPGENSIAQLCLYLAERAKEYLDVSHFVQNKYPQSKMSGLLSILLLERTNETIILTLKTMAFIEDREIISTAIAAINSQNAAHIDNAIETMLALKNRSLAGSVISVLEMLRGIQTDGQQHMTQQEFDSFCSNQNDSWLQNCLHQLTRSRKFKEHAYA